MCRVTAIALASCLAIGFSGSPAAAGPGSETVKGQVIQLEQHLHTQNQGEETLIRVRTRQGEELRLRLGQAGPCDECIQVGDQIRARLMSGPGPNGAYQIRTMRVRRANQIFRFGFQNGNAVQQGPGTQARDGSNAGQGPGGGYGVRSRDRIHTPGSCGAAAPRGGGAGPRRGGSS